MKKLWLICLVTINLQADCPLDLQKYKTALTACNQYVEALKNENILFDEKAQAADAAAKEAIEMASKDNFLSLSTTEWTLIGGMTGVVGGMVLAKVIR